MKIVALLLILLAAKVQSFLVVSPVVGRSAAPLLAGPMEEDDFDGKSIFVVL
jgi:hypothetical protein